MMYLDAPPRLIATEVFSAMPDHFRRKGTRTDWAGANRLGSRISAFSTRHCEGRSNEAIQLSCGNVDCFAQPVIGRRFAPTRWLTMTGEDECGFAKIS
jgi:hypothetical protein